MTKWDLSEFFFTKPGEKKKQLETRSMTYINLNQHVLYMCITIAFTSEIPIQVTLHGDECFMYQSLRKIYLQNYRTMIIIPGQCQDYHPDCYSFVMSGMCDDKSIFKEAFSVRDFCMLSCGVCNRYGTCVLCSS